MYNLKEEYFSNIEQAIKNAQAMWESKEVQESLKRTCQNSEKLEEIEHKKDNDDIRFIVSKLRVRQWLNNCFLKEYSKQVNLFHIKTSYYWNN